MSSGAVDRRVMANVFEQAPSTAREAEAPDAVLVEAWRAGDGAALERLIRRHQGGVYRLMLRTSGDATAAEDLTQKTFLKALDRLGRLRRPEAFKGWLYQVALNTARNRRRNAWRWRSTEADPDTRPTGGPAADESLALQEDQARVRQAIDTLPKRQRQVVHLRLYAELPYREIADILGTTEASAKVNYHHAVRTLRARLAPNP